MFGLPFISNKGKRVKSLLRQRGISIDDSRTINRKSQRRPDRKYAARPMSNKITKLANQNRDLNYLIGSNFRVGPILDDRLKKKLLKP